MKKILLAVHHFPPRHTGGAEWRALRTAKALLARGHEVRVVCVESILTPSGGGIKAEIDIFQGVPVERLSFDLHGSSDPFLMSYDNHLVGEYIDNRLSAFRPDLLHVIGGYLISGRPLAIAAEREIPTVVTLTDYWFLCPRINMVQSNGDLSSLPLDPAVCARCLAEESRRYRWPSAVLPGLMDKYWSARTAHADRLAQRQAFLLSTLSRVNAVISPSRFLRSMFIQWGIDRKKIIYSRQGRTFDPSAETISEGRAGRDEGMRIGFLGQIAAHKGVHILVKAVSEVRDPGLRLLVYGDTRAFPDYMNRLKSLSGKDGRIRFVGHILPDELSNVYGDLDVVVVPSLWYENSPNVILEARAHRVPIIASNLGGMAEMVRSEVDGLLFSPGDYKDLSRQIQRLRRNPDLLDTLRRNAPQVKTAEEEIDELEEVYRALTDVPSQVEA